MVLSRKTKWSVLEGRGWGRVVGTLNVCSVAKCKFLSRIDKLKMLYWDEEV